MAIANILLYLLFLVIVTALVPPAGAYMQRVFERKHTWLDPSLVRWSAASIASHA